MAELAEKTAIAAKQEALAAETRAEQYATIVRAYRDDKRSLRSIAEVTKLSHEGVRQILLDNNVELRGRGRPGRTEP